MRLMMLFGRLGNGVTATHASAELKAIDAQRLAEQGAAPQTAGRIIAEAVRGIPNPGSRFFVQRVTTLMAAVVALVLLIACLNVGNLLLVRGAVRQREFAVRRALGASRVRLLRQLLTESLVLGIAGGIACLVLAVWTTKLLGRSLPAIATIFAVQLNLSLDWRVLAFATITSLATTIVCGLVPAWRTSQARGVVPFKSEIGSGLPRRRPVGLIVQVIMSLVLLFVATRQDIFREVVSHGLAIVLVGVAIGEVLTAALTGVVGSLQQGVRSTGLASHVVVGVIWFAVACAACYLPAARAARVDPLVALRYE